MKRFFTRRVMGLLAVVCATLVSEGLSPAQTGSRPYPVGRRVEEMNRQAEQYEREGRSRSEKRDERRDRKPSRAAAVQVREDFGRIQIIYNELVLAMSAGKILEDNFIADALEGINKSAIRLKSNLALPRIDDKENDQKKENGLEVKLQRSLTLLCSHISNFVTNPLFESSGALDVELSIKASRDLDEIIELSDHLKKKTEKLKHD
ncbi:MAG: hypothetical protein ABR568_06305 [Pyrinomonadaceae bacterium]